MHISEIIHILVKRVIFTVLKTSISEEDQIYGKRQRQDKMQQFQAKKKNPEINYAKM